MSKEETVSKVPVDPNDPFAQAVKQREIEKAEEEEKKNRKPFEVEYENIKWTPLIDGVDKVFRIIGLPYPVRQDPTDVKILFQSRILTDSGNSYMYCNWKQTLDSNGRETGELDENWFLYRFFREVTERKWEKYPEGTLDENKKTGHYVYLNAETATYKRIDANKKERDKYPPHFYPRKRILMNVIDRQDDWCKTNKSCKVLTSRMSSWDTVDKKTNEKKTIWFNDTGVPYEIYKKLIDDVIAYSGDWRNYDVVIKKLSSDKTYSVRDIFEKKISDKAKEIGSEDPLTSEELAYELIDFDKVFPVCSYYKIKKNIKGLITMWDAENGTTKWMDELNRLVKEEKEQREALAEEAGKKELAETEEFSSSIEEKKEEAPIVSAVTPEETHIKEEIQEEEQPKRRRQASEDVKTSIEDECKANFPQWDSLSPSEKASMLKSIARFDGKVPFYKNSLTVLPCIKADECKFLDSDKNTVFPDDVLTCPICGEQDNSEV